MVMLHANDMLDQRIIENGSFVPQYALGSVREAILEMIQIIKLTLFDRKFDICYDKARLHRIPRAIKFDKRRLQQVLLNLLSNAVKFTSKGEIKVDAIVESKSNGKQFLEVSVTDSGIGLTKGEAKDVFIPFKLLNNPRRQL